MLNVVALAAGVLSPWDHNALGETSSGFEYLAVGFVILVIGTPEVPTLLRRGYSPVLTLSDWLLALSIVSASAFAAAYAFLGMKRKHSWKSTLSLAIAIAGFATTAAWIARGLIVMWGVWVVGAALMSSVILEVMSRRSKLAAFVVILTVWSASPADAQGGCPEIATCRGFLGSDFVFAAKVSGIRGAPPAVDADGKALDLNERLVTLAVGDVFRGIVPATVEITVTGECDAQFEVGKEYLIYGTSLQDLNTGRVRIGIDGCSRTRLLAEAGADLAFIKSVGARRSRPQARTEKSA